MVAKFILVTALIAMATAQDEYYRVPRARRQPVPSMNRGDYGRPQGQMQMQEERYRPVPQPQPERMPQYASQEKFSDPYLTSQSKHEPITAETGHHGHGHDYVDYGAYTGGWGAFGWYSDHPVGGGWGH